MASLSVDFSGKLAKDSLPRTEHAQPSSGIQGVISSFLGREPAQKGINLLCRAIHSVVNERPSPHEVFWRLGADWWKQIYDGVVHPYGRYVFDQGLHGGPVEPGFYNNVKAACIFASRPDVIMRDPTVELYQALHSVACRHFDGKSTLMGAEGVGRFTSPLDKNLVCRNSIFSLFRSTPELYESIKREYEIQYERFELGELLQNEKNIFEKFALLLANGVTLDEANENYLRAGEWCEQFQKDVLKKLKKLNHYISDLSRQLGLHHPLATLSYDPHDVEKIIIRYQCTKKEVDYLIPRIFAEYRHSMAETRTKRLKIANIAFLFQLLEWIHPFNDGQGRTDLILLAKELCRYGFNPAILEDPYYSTFATIEEWVEYLEDGMQNWRDLEAEINRPAHEVQPTLPVAPAASEPALKKRRLS